MLFIRSRFLAKGKPVINPERCKGCCLCITACPKKILKMSEQTNMQGVHYAVCFDEEKCIACAFCAIMCPDIAIQIIKYDQVGAGKSTGADNE